jgi:FlaA1/EpsC-like NDP-sugar epimerase
MRPGEKLSEELVGPGETVSGEGPILGINPVTMTDAALDAAIAELSSLADALDHTGARQALLRIATGARDRTDAPRRTV